MKGHWIRYTEEQLAWIKGNCTLPQRELHAQFQARFDRPEVTMGNLVSLRKRRGWFSGRDGRFQPGQESWNKGVPMEKWAKPDVIDRMKNGQFKPGSRSGFAAKLWKPIGTERWSKEGYLERKINNDLPLKSRWRAVHLIRWEEVNGPIPKGHCLKSLDGDKTNTDPANWKVIPRAVLSRLNGGRYKRRPSYDEAEPEVRPALMTLAELEHRISEVSE